MDFVSFDIRGGDFMEAGAASRQIKEHLKRIGADAGAIRRAMIAAYEAEMNVVIHSTGGRLQAAIGEDRVDIDVVDEGPGIADVDLALKEGYSTASSEARALGFGAGMGLPNIERNSDRFGITSTVGDGTRVSFSIFLRPQPARPTAALALLTDPDRCRDCRRCVTACPTAAIRVHDSVPSVLEHLCIECTACIAACRPGALGIEGVAAAISPAADAVLAVPPGLLAAFGRFAGAATVLARLDGLGYGDVISVHAYDDALHEAVLSLAAKRSLPWPVISPVCPAVCNLIELRFPSLLGQLAPLCSPWEALQAGLGGRPATFVVSCPAQRSALRARADGKVTRVVCPSAVAEAVVPLLMTADDDLDDDEAAPAPAADGALRVTGIAHVLAVLEEAEDGLLADVPVLEPFACPQGCFGSPLLPEDAFVAERRWAGTVDCIDPRRAETFARTVAFAARPGIRLDADMARAIEKLARLEAITLSLPGKDCAVCGAPTCAALAEDVVMARAELKSCPYLERSGSAS